MGAHHGREPGRPSNHERLFEVAEWVAIGVAVAVYAGSFGLASPLQGLGEVQEVFGQDSRYVIRALSKDIRYEWNAQNHVFYHLVTDGGFRLVRAIFGIEANVSSAFAFLKALTTLTGVLYLVVFRWLLRSLGLTARERSSLVPVAALSVAAWFHFAAFETSGLTLPAVLGAMLLFVRRVRDGDVSRRNHVLLVGALLVAFWTRSDQFRLPFALGVVSLLPALRSLRAGLMRDLVAFAVLAPVGYALLTAVYFGIDPMSALSKFVEREDHHGLVDKLMRVENFSPRNLWVMLRAISVYGLVMPLGDQRFPFNTGARWFFPAPLAVAALLATLAFLGTTAFRSAQKLRRLDPLHALLWVTWLSGWLFYTWFNPHEPFLWIVQFGILVLVAFADTFRDRPRVHAAVVGGFGLLVVAHNAVYFWLRYR